MWLGPPPSPPLQPQATGLEDGIAQPIILQGLHQGLCYGCIVEQHSLGQPTGHTGDDGNRIGLRLLGCSKCCIVWWVHERRARSSL